VYRFVHVPEAAEPTLREEFRSDRENGLVPFTKRGKRFPEILDGMFAYNSQDSARQRWDQCRGIAESRGEPIQIGQFVVEVELTPEQDFFLEGLAEEDGHLTIWGDPDRLAGATRRIYSPTHD
jgi:hypothetical protein